MDAIWTVLRLCGIVVGVATLLRLATIGFGVDFNDVFQAFLDRMQILFELDAVIDVVEEWVVIPALTWLRNANLAIPELQPHWRQVFTLTWLLMAANGRNNGGGGVAIFVSIAWALICALLASVGAGTQTLASSALALWPLAAYSLFLAGFAITEVVEGRETLAGTAGIFVASVLLLSAIGGLGFYGTLAIATSLSVNPDSPSLLGLIGAIGLLGIFYGFLGLYGYGRWWAASQLSVALDIWGVLGGALAIGYVMMK